ncbi:MAG: hypothetical protein ACOH19_07590 [Rhodoglobus sp.]
MKKSLISLGLIPLVLVGLSACSLQVRDDAPASPSPDASSTQKEPQTEPEPETDTDNPVSNGGFSDGDCTGKDVTIDQDGTNAVLSGNCGAITVSASSVFVTVENAESLTVLGTLVDVVVSEKVGSVSLGGEQNSYNGGDVTTLEVPGSSISVTLNNVGSASISGSNNFVVWSTGAASANDSGTGNTVVAP